MCKIASVYNYFFFLSDSDQLPKSDSTSTFKSSTVYAALDPTSLEVSLSQPPFPHHAASLSVLHKRPTHNLRGFCFSPFTPFSLFSLPFLSELSLPSCMPTAIALCTVWSASLKWWRAQHSAAHLWRECGFHWDGDV